MNKIIVGSITNYTPQDIKPWVISVKRNVPDAFVYMIVLNAPKETLDYLKENKIDVVTASELQQDGSLKYSANVNICVERFMFYSKLFNIFNPDDIVMATDVKDVVFQRSPFPILERMSEHGSIFLSSEGITYENETWGANNLKLSFGQSKFDEIGDKIIANAGVLAGKVHALRVLSEMIYRYSLSTGLSYVPGGGGPDQAALNVLINNPFIISHCIFSQSLTCQAGTVNNPVYKDKIVHLGGIMNENHLVVNVANDVYPVVHQYDRIPEWKDNIKEKYT